jgi:hypothetical protein
MHTLAAFFIAANGAPQPRICFAKSTRFDIVAHAGPHSPALSNPPHASIRLAPPSRLPATSGQHVFSHFR